MVLGAREGEETVFSIILSKYIKITWLTVQVKSHYNKYCRGKRNYLNNIKVLQLLGPEEKALRTLEKINFLLLSRKIPSAFPSASHSTSPTRKEQSYAHITARRKFKLSKALLFHK